MGALLVRPGPLLLLLLFIVLHYGYTRLPYAGGGIGRSPRVFKAETEGLRWDSSAAAMAEQAAAVAPAVLIAPPAPLQAAAVSPAAPAQLAHGPRYLVDPVTRQQVLAQPVAAPADAAPRA